MTDQPYTPTKAEIMDSYRRGRVWATPNGGRTYAAEFERWYKKVIATAEQRGAARGKAEGYDTALNEVASRGLISIDAHDLLNLNNPYRADQETRNA